MSAFGGAISPAGTCTCVYIYIYIYIYIYMYIHVCVHVYMCVYMYACTQTDTHTHAHTQTHTHTHTRTHTRIMHAHTGHNILTAARSIRFVMPGTMCQCQLSAASTVHEPWLPCRMRVSPNCMCVICAYICVYVYV